MSEDVYAKPDLAKKVRFQVEEKDRNADVYDNTSNVTIYDNYWAEGSTPPESQDNTAGDQQQSISSSASVSPGKKNPVRAAAAFLGLLCLLFLAAVITLVVLWIQDKSSWDMERNRLWVDNANLTSEREELQTSYSEMKILNHNLTQQTKELENKIEASKCRANWIKFGKSCYYISTSKKKWVDSKTTCEGLDALLVIVSSVEEQKFISLFERNSWIGLTDEEKENTWKWVNGEEPSRTYWGTGQPDNDKHRGPENCVMIKPTWPDLKNWNDVRCTNSYDFICEKLLE